MVRLILRQFLPRFLPEHEILWCPADCEVANPKKADTRAMESAMARLTGDQPEVIARNCARGWSAVVQVASGSGPVTAVRRRELTSAFAEFGEGLVFVTAVRSRAGARAYIEDIGLGTVVWSAEEPGHLIHFGEAEY